MMDYKKIISSRKLRFAILKTLSWVPDRVMLALQYRMKLGRRLDLKDPERWTEKLQVYKMKYRNPVTQDCVDKFNVRRYVEGKGLRDILVNLYGVYDNVDEIDFGRLPESFVLKTTGGGGGLNVILVRDKDAADLTEIRKKLESWQETPASNYGREWAYSGISRSRIIAEELLVNRRNPDAGVEDYKILCFGGKPAYIIVDKDRYTCHKRNFYTTDWTRVDITTDHEQFDDQFPEPENLDRMLEVAGILSGDFPFVRVDLYNVDGRICFGELTFYPWSGYVNFKPDSFDYELGALMDY